MIECIAVSDPAGMELDSAVQSSAVTLYAANAQDEAVLTACAAQVRVLYQNAWDSIMKIGATLTQAKEHCAYGTWGKWVETECGFSQKTAARYIAVFDRFRDNENVLALPGSLSYALLGVPDDEEVNELAMQAKEENWTERQLKQEIASRKAAEKEAEAAREKLRQAEELAQKMESDYEREIARMSEGLRASSERESAIADNLHDADERIKDLHEQLKKARENTRIKIVEKCMENVPIDYDIAKKEAAELMEKNAAQQEEIDQLKEALKAEKERMTAEQVDIEIDTMIGRLRRAVTQSYKGIGHDELEQYLCAIKRGEKFFKEFYEIMMDEG